MMRSVFRVLAVIIAGSFAHAFAQSSPNEDTSKTAPHEFATLSPAPPMGWNSWDSYGLTITEKQFRSNVQVLHDKLAPFGWRYAVIDEGWFFQNPLDRPHPEQLKYQFDGFGRYVPVPARFPSAAPKTSAPSKQDGPSTIDEQNLGFVDLGRWVHSQGLKFGIHIVRGIPRESVRMNTLVEGSAFHAKDLADQSDACPWDPTNWGVRDNAAGQAWYDALLRQYASWGVDLLKVDCISDHPYKQSEIQQIHNAIAKTGRPMILSLSPGPTNLSHAAEVTSLSNMWRISDDVWDIWDGQGTTIKGQFARLSEWSSYTKPGNWPDADMLPLGQLTPHPEVGPGPRKTRLTADEQQTQLNLWGIARSPLILGANLTVLDPTLLGLLTNKDLIRINQTAISSHQALQEDSLVVWVADLPEGEHAVALFNIGDTVLKTQKPLSAFISGGDVGNLRARKINTTIDQPLSADLHQTLAPHASVVYLIK